MKKFFNLIRLALSARFYPTVHYAAKELLRRMYNKEFFYGLQFDLTKDFIVPDPKIPITIKKLNKTDVPKILDLKEKGINYLELYERIKRLLFVKSDIPRCYVGITDQGVPCVMCWMIQYPDNDKIQSYFSGNILNLQPNEVLLEEIYTHPAFRGLNLMQYITFKLFEKASENGAQRAIAFLKSDNSASLKGSKRIGWQPYMIKKVSWRVFKRQITYSHELPDMQESAFSKTTCE